MGEIISLIFGGLAVILGFVNYLVKTREQVLYVHIATTISFAIHFLFIKDGPQYAAVAMQLVGTVRNIVYFKLGKEKPVDKKWGILFALTMGSMGSVTLFVLQTGAWYGILNIIGQVINSFALSFSNPNNLRKSILITSPLVLIYGISVGSVDCAVYESIVIISSIIGLARYGRVKKEIKQ